MNSKSQTAIEFFVLIGFIIGFFLFFLLIIQENTTQKLDQERGKMVEDLAAEVQDEINLASGSTDGYSRQFSIPENLFNKDYNISLEDESVYLYTIDGKYAIVLPIPEVNGSIQKGVNTIRKENGEILLNQ